MSPKQRSWMTEILHRRAMLQNTTLKRGAGVQVIVYCQICLRRCRISSINSSAIGGHRCRGSGMATSAFFGGTICLRRRFEEPRFLHVHWAESVGALCQPSCTLDVWLRFTLNSGIYSWIPDLSQIDCLRLLANWERNQRHQFKPNWLFEM